MGEPVVHVPGERDALLCQDALDLRRLLAVGRICLRAQGVDESRPCRPDTAPQQE